jgi:dihydroorotate dehydrogenase (fumarate)
MDLRTKYLGLDLPHPFVAGASPLADTPDRARQLQDAGVAAIVLRSLFEEQIDVDALAHYAAEAAHADSHGEAGSYLAETDGCVFGPDAYLAHVAEVKAAVGIPVIASLNAHSHGGWIDYARRIADAGADALELNLYHVATDPHETADDLEERSVDIVRDVVAAVRIPVAVKLSPFYTSLPNFARQLVAAGASGLVLFNRFYEPDIDIEHLEVRTHLELSHSHELPLRLRWLAILSGQTSCDLAVSGGVHTEKDAIKSVMCGAHAVQLVAALLRGGLDAVERLRTDTARWLREHGYDSLAQMRGSMDISRTPDPRAFERGNYMRLLQTYRVE